MSPQGVSRKHKSMGTIFFVSLLLFLVAAGFSGGLFLYNGYVQNNIDKKKKELEQARANFAPAQIQELQRLNVRIDTVKELLNRHIATSQLFSILEQNTLKTVQFDDLQFLALPDGNATLAIKGTANSFASLALQSDVLGKVKEIRNPMFSGLNLDQEGNAVFSLDASVDRDALSYRKIAERLFPSFLPTELSTSTPAISGEGATTTGASGTAGNDTAGVESVPVKETLKQ